MSLRAYLEAQPFHEIATRKGERPSNAVAFCGLPRKHPYDDSKFVLLCDPLSDNPRFLEFKVTDLFMAEELPSPVSESGESLPVVKVWVRKGGFGLEYLPFEVDDPPRRVNGSQALREHFSKGMDKS